jgi:hypothetical protein
MDATRILLPLGALCLVLIAAGAMWLYIRIKNSNLGRQSRLRETRSMTPPLPREARNALRTLLTEALIGKPKGGRQ